MDELKKLTLAGVAAIALCPPAYAHKDCMREIVSSRDGWAQVRGQPGLSGKPLWRITNGMSVTWCGEELPDNHGHPWKWITFQSEQEPWDHDGWVAAGLLGLSSSLAAPEPVRTAAPAAPVVPAPAEAPVEQHPASPIRAQSHITPILPDARRIEQQRGEATRSVAPAIESAEQELISWSGNGSRNTRPFNVKGPWEIQWESDKYIFIEVYDKDGKYVDNSGIESDSGRGNSFQPTGGDYYLNIKGGGAWTVRVVAIADEEKANAEVDKPPLGKTPVETPKPPEETPKWETLSQAALSHGEMPTIEKTFIDIIDNAKERYSRGTTDLQKGAARPARAQQICAALHGQANDWIGTIAQLTTNSDGYGVLKIEIANGISVTTFNNSLSDVKDYTLIAPKPCGRSPGSAGEAAIV